MKKQRIISFLLAFILILSSLPGALAEEADSENIAEAFDTENMDAVVEECLKELRADPSHVSVAFKDTASDRYYYYNADRWIYTASLYKLPVCMSYANRLKNGEAEADSLALPDDEVFRKVLEFSDYCWVVKLANEMYGTSRTNESMRRQDLEYAGFSEEDLPKNFFSKSLYSARFCLAIVEELYENAGEYPNVIEHMKLASPDKYLRKNLGDEYEIAQKYGSDLRCVHAAGIIYTDSPILIVIMTDEQFDRTGNAIIGALAERIVEELS